MELKFEAPRKNEFLALDKYNVNGKDESIPVRNDYPRNPLPCFSTEDFDLKKFMQKRAVMIAKSRANDIIIKDPDPQWVSAALLDTYDELEPILLKDSVRCFLRLFENSAGKGMSSNLTVTSQTLTFIVSLNAMRCAKVVLEGVAPELRGMHANPNCINRYGYFPIHEAAERFAVDMIKLLLRHGASANVRTVGGNVIENLLPLHVAVENTCLHKYLEDNLSLSQNPLDYIYKLIHLLCLPEMKIFLDTTRLLAEKTNNLLQELWKYIEDGKIIQSAVLLLAAQEQIRRGSSSKINGSSKTNGFDIINKCIMRLSFALKWEKDSHGMAQELLEERKKLTDCAWLLVDVFSHAGEDLSAYIKVHSEVPHMEVFQHVSSILKEYGFCPTGDTMDTIKLRPYDCRKSDGAPCKGPVDANMAVMGTANLDAAGKKAVRTKVGGGWDPTYTKRSFYPFWRSVLQARFPKVYPAYASEDPWSGRKPGQLCVPLQKANGSGSTPTPNHKFGLVQRVLPRRSNDQPRRCFITAATGAFRLLKVLK
ncbi:uncharacterized protein LOC112268724 isoform X2 [Brachypodium distachyon]|uniref:Uncharacterized protein n=1 Tax=Brachypodium distachyon TaxID=15368 RepID=A0A2K2CP73_BRADI|nr:uncharacterized protein LOC112268724 isoform X2 [Brachypodium distachyon]PNT63846.1 hypothetical protein BRADI_4g21724v3 [Brachypodium distachyon]PNT63847.1 hypothetical protein BRADI_4g21724v3 [Brachypodium distachyon]|eukprot:XP_024310519.1 uncharacterized protein LOC112268724 isoform X2 [Brachypodium distachyon]